MSGQTLDVVDSNRMSKDDEGKECIDDMLDLCRVERSRIGKN